jgi:hypothetical protein
MTSYTFSSFNPLWQVPVERSRPKYDRGPAAIEQPSPAANDHEEPTRLN